MVTNEQKGFMEGWFGKYVLPGVIFQSVLIGGGYATGREIVEFGARFGALGWWGIVAIFIGFSVISILTYELARTFKAYDYRNWVKQIIWKLWPLFDVLFIVMAVLVIAIVGSATGNIVKDILGWPYWVGVSLAIIVVGFLNFYGRKMIEGFKTIGTVLLYFGYVVFAGIVLSKNWGHVQQVFATGDTSYVGSVSLGAVFWVGILYVAYNLVCLPATFFTLDRQTERKHTFWAGIITGLLATVPFALTYLSMMGFYPSKEVLGAPVPWLVMLKESGGTGLIALFGIVIGWTLIETCTGLIHAITERIDVNLKEMGKTGLTAQQSVFISVGTLVAALILSKVGIIALVAKGYTFMAYGFLILFALPLLTIGIIRILNPGWHQELWEKSVSRKSEGVNL